MSPKGPDHGLSVHELQDFHRAESQEQDAAKTKGGTSADLADMQRMGRTQELRVCFPRLPPTLLQSLTGFSVTSNLLALLVS